MRKSCLFAAVASISALAAIPSLAATSTIHYVSQPGDFVGQGETHTYTQADGTFVVTRHPDNGVTVAFDHATLGGVDWTASFAAADSVELMPGSFPNAQQFPGQNSGHPGLNFSGSGRSCSSVTGLFTVHDLVWDLFGVPRRFDADLEQHCGSATPALFADVTHDFGGMGPLLAAHGNLLVTSSNLIYEYTPAGGLVSIRPILGELPGGGRATERLGDLTVGPSGLFHAYVGFNDPVLSTGNPGTGSWRHDTDPSWLFTASFRGIAAYGAHVFVADSSGANGILRFDTTNDYSATPFDFSQDYLDLTMGWDGVLYALQGSELSVDRIDPTTLALQGTIDLAQPVRAIAVNPAGEIFGTTPGGTIYRFSAAGAVLDSLAAGIGGLTDIDRDAYGRLAVGTVNLMVGLTNESLESVTPITVSATSNTATYVTWVTPELANPNVIFVDGFGLGDTTSWSAVSP